MDNFINYTINKNYIDTLREYRKICKDLMYHPKCYDIIYYIRDRFIEYAEETCELYTKNAVFHKPDLLNKNLWYNKSYPYINNSTNGTTGPRFNYLIWQEIYEFIERDCHYKYVADEFDIDRYATVFNMLANVTSDQTIIENGYNDNIINTHGLTDAYSYSIAKNDLYYTDQKRYFKEIVEFISSTKLDIILTSGNILNGLCEYMRNVNYNGKICNLLSNTCEPFLVSDYDYIKDHINNFSDHMRCWDGGVTFFTCKYGTYHLCDNLSYVSNIDGKLVSDDFFSVCSPFFNYWNGDYANIGKRIFKCKCGRYYRNFKLSRSRDFTIGNVGSDKIRDAIVKSSMSNVKMVKCDVSRLIITTTNKPSDDAMAVLKEELPTFDIQYEIQDDGQSIDYDFLITQAKQNTCNIPETFRLNGIGYFAGDPFNGRIFNVTMTQSALNEWTGTLGCATFLAQCTSCNGGVGLTINDGTIKNVACNSNPGLCAGVNPQLFNSSSNNTSLATCATGLAQTVINISYVGLRT